MRNITLFCEDSFHEKFLEAILNRFCKEYGVPIGQRFFSSRGGLPKMHAEFKEFLRDLSRDKQPIPDSLIVVVDANCKGYNDRKRLMQDQLEHFPAFQQLVTYAIPDPHIERWMLVDSTAFRQVFTRGCTLPAIKCSKDEYKRILRTEIRKSGIEAPLGGEEFAEDIAMAMDLGRVETCEASIGLFFRSLKALFNTWRAD